MRYQVNFQWLSVVETQKTLNYNLKLWSYFFLLLHIVTSLCSSPRQMSFRLTFVCQHHVVLMNLILPLYNLHHEGFPQQVCVLDNTLSSTHYLILVFHHHESFFIDPCAHLHRFFDYVFTRQTSKHYKVAEVITISWCWRFIILNVRKWLFFHYKPVSLRNVSVLT